MNVVEVLLAEKLRSRNPTLDFSGPDRRILQIACQDLKNYLKVCWGLVGKEGSGQELLDKFELFYWMEPKQLGDFLDLWSGMWLRKWRERVKLVAGDEEWKTLNGTAKTLRRGEQLWMNLANRGEMLDLVASTLVKNGEICGTSILAENLLKMELGENAGKYMSGGEETLNVVNNVLRKARRLAKSKGPLIFVRIDKGYYNSSL
jgi:hypothetical protein